MPVKFERRLAMKIKGLLVLIFLISGAAGIITADTALQEEALTSLIEKIAVRMESYPELENWKAGLLTTNIEVDKKGNPKKLIKIKMLVTVRGDERTEDILEVLRTKKGKTSDITEEYLRKVEKQKAKMEKRKAKQAEKENGNSRFKISLEELLPFSMEKRNKYSFELLEEIEHNEIPVYVLKSKAESPGEKYWEGQYLIHKDTYDLLRIEISPSENPKYVKKFDIKMDFAVLPDGYFVVKQVKTWINAGMFLKRIRMISTQEYSDYEVLDLP
jgi:hypothetical protein